MKKPILVIGAGGHAKILIDIIQESNEYYIEAVIGTKNEKIDNLMGYKVLKGDEYLEEYKKSGISNVVIGIGGYTNNNKRKEMFNDLTARGFNIISLIHPSSIIASSVKIGSGVVIFAGVILCPEVEVGDNVIIATGSSVDHESIIKNHVLISAGVTVGAGNLISEGALLGLGSKIISRVSIGENSLIAAGAVVVTDIESNVAIYGVPGKQKFENTNKN